MARCPFCTFSHAYRSVRKYSHWTVYVADNQEHLGRMMIVLKKHKEYLVELTDKELIELRDICREMQNALNTIFKPDWYNYSQAGNIVRHLHFHLIPRYKKKRQFLGRSFRDNYAKPLKQWHVEPEKFLKELARTIKKHA